MTRLAFAFAATLLGCGTEGKDVPTGGSPDKPTASSREAPQHAAEPVAAATPDVALEPVPPLDLPTAGDRTGMVRAVRGIWLHEETLLFGTRRSDAEIAVTARIPASHLDAPATPPTLLDAIVAHLDGASSVPDRKGAPPAAKIYVALPRDLSTERSTAMFRGLRAAGVRTIELATHDGLALRVSVPPVFPLSARPQSRSVVRVGAEGRTLNMSPFGTKSPEALGRTLPRASGWAPGAHQVFAIADAGLPLQSHVDLIADVMGWYSGPIALDDSGAPDRPPPPLAEAIRTRECNDARRWAERISRWPDDAWARLAHIRVEERVCADLEAATAARQAWKATHPDDPARRIEEVQRRLDGISDRSEHDWRVEELEALAKLLRPVPSSGPLQHRTHVLAKRVHEATAMQFWWIGPDGDPEEPVYDARKELEELLAQRADARACAVKDPPATPVDPCPLAPDPERLADAREALTKAQAKLLPAE